MKILVVDDEPDIVELVSYNLRKEGYEVSTAMDGLIALSKIRSGIYDLIILDLMLPGVGGFEVCKQLRSDPMTARLPVIMLTAKGEETDRVRGLETGSDDYVTKPFSPRELVARVKAVLRRTGKSLQDEGSLRVGDLTINRQSYSVMKKNTPVPLSSTEFRLLLFLAERRGRVFTRDQLLNAVWKDEAYVEPRTVDVHIRRLRTQIEDDPANPAWIKTKRGIGYYMDAQS